MPPWGIVPRWPTAPDDGRPLKGYKMLTNEHLISENAHNGGVQRLYKFPSGWGLSLINSPLAHSFKYAWEAAVLNPRDQIDYTTDLTSDVVVFDTDDEANEFISRAYTAIGRAEG